MKTHCWTGYPDIMHDTQFHIIIAQHVKLYVHLVFVHARKIIPRKLRPRDKYFLPLARMPQSYPYIPAEYTLFLLLIYYANTRFLLKPS